MNQRALLVAAISGILAIGGAGCGERAGSSTDIIIGQQMEFQSDILEMPVKLKVYLPEGYESSEEVYPVLYIFRDYFHLGSGLVQDLVRNNRIPPIVIIDFINCPFNHFTPTAIESSPGTGKADELIRFLEEELIPYADRHYRTRDYRIIFAQSWGGMFCGYALLTRPNIFRAALASSPWLIYDGEEQFFLKNAENWLDEHEYGNNFLFFTGGNQPELVPSMKQLVWLLEGTAPEGLRWQYDPMVKADHGALVSKTLFAGLKELYGDWATIPDSVMAGGPPALRRYRNGLASRYGYDIGFSRLSLNRYGWNLKQEGKLEEAKAIFEYYIEAFPNAPHAYGSLGKTYEDLGEFGKARECYQRAIAKAEQFRPGNVETYRTYLKALEQKQFSDEQKR
jgi:enterochelin esterase-like enzyme